MKRIAVFSSGRWDAGHLYWVMKSIEASDKLELTVSAPINHHNIDELRKEFKVKPTISITGIKDYGVFYNDFARVLRELMPDILLLLGDRFETNAAATAALLLNIPIAHCHGGEKDGSGSFDDELRNSITMMATWHFTAHEEYAENVARMIDLCTNRHNYCEYLINKENKPCRNELWNKVFNVGSPGLDWFTHAKLYSKEELQQYVSIDLNQPYILVCLHPETKIKPYFDMGLRALNFFHSIAMYPAQMLVIRANCDPNNEVINCAIDTYAKEKSYKFNAVDNFDHLVYLSLMQYAEMMVGNSSSGIIEAASFNLPAVNIGTRQQGRIMPPNVINCGYGTDEILAAMDKAKGHDRTKAIENPYGDGHSSERIVKILEEIE